MHTRASILRTMPTLKLYRWAGRQEIEGTILASLCNPDLFVVQVGRGTERVYVSWGQVIESLNNGTPLII